jgi:hypothetical protein
MKRIERIMVSVGPREYLRVGGDAQMVLDRIDARATDWNTGRERGMPVHDRIVVRLDVVANRHHFQVDREIRTNDFEGVFDNLMRYLVAQVKEAVAKLPDEPETKRSPPDEAGR